MKRKPEVESGLEPEKSPQKGTFAYAQAEDARFRSAVAEEIQKAGLGPVPPDQTPDPKADALAFLNILEDRCRYGGSVGLADLRKVIAILRGG